MQYMNKITVNLNEKKDFCNIVISKENEILNTINLTFFELYKFIKILEQHLNEMELLIIYGQANQKSEERHQQERQNESQEGCCKTSENGQEV